MPIYRAEKNRDFTIMSNLHLRDERLSRRQRGCCRICCRCRMTGSFRHGDSLQIAVKGATLSEKLSVSWRQRAICGGRGDFVGNIHIFQVLYVNVLRIFRISSPATESYVSPVI